METLTISRDTRAYHLEDFCGKSLIQFTGATKVKTNEGDIQIEFGDTIIKNDDGTFSVNKNNIAKLETEAEIEKSNACEAFIKDLLTKLVPDSIFLQEPDKSTFIGNMRNAFYQGSKFKPSVLSEDEAIEHLTKFSQNNQQ